MRFRNTDKHYGARPLTDREKEILRMKREGLADKQVGRALNITCETVKEHLQHIRKKLAVKDTPNAVLVDYVMQEYLNEA